jgi:hypothetical protein
MQIEPAVDTLQCQTHVNGQTIVNQWVSACRVRVLRPPSRPLPLAQAGRAGLYNTAPFYTRMSCAPAETPAPFPHRAAWDQWVPAVTEGRHRLFTRGLCGRTHVQGGTGR